MNMTLTCCWSRSAGTTRPKPSANRTRPFKSLPGRVVMCQRALIRYRTYLVLMYYSRGWRAQPTVADVAEHHPTGQCRRLSEESRAVPG